MKTKIIGILVCTLLIATAIPAAGIIDKNLVTNSVNAAEWTIMVYLDADNELEDAGIDDFLEMSSVGSTEEVNIVVQFDRIFGFTEDYGNWNTTKRFLITKGLTPDADNAIMDIGEANMGDPQTVIDFVNWAMDSYPASRYFLVYWDHGIGWKSLCICEDWTDGDTIDLDELTDVLETITDNGNNPFDLIGFDACMMQMIEVAYELSDYGYYMTASEQFEPTDGWSYDAFLAVLVSNPTMPPESLGEYVVNTYEGSTLSTVDLGLIDELRDVVSDLGVVLQDEENREIIHDLVGATASYSDPDYCDLYDFTVVIIDYQEYIIDPDEIIQKAINVQIGINETVTSAKNVHRKSHGISIYMPSDAYYPDYDELLFAIDTQWDEYLKWLCGGQTSDPPEPPTINGPTTGKPREEYDYTIMTTDPDGDDVYFYVDWGDGRSTNWKGPVASGEEIIISNSWARPGFYCISTCSIDTHWEMSGTTILSVSIPKNKAINTPFLDFLQQYPILYQLLLRFLRL